MLPRILLFISAFNFFTAYPQNNWELAKEKDGIKVFTRKETNSKFKSIRVEANIAGTMDKLLKVLMDASSNKDWVYNTNESYLIKKISPFEVISYTETTLPWPASNRDVPLHMTISHNPKLNTLKVVAKGIPNAIPPKKGIVRIPYFNSWWDVKYDGKNRLNIVYFLEMDPGGTVPAWLVNMFVAKGPYETFTGLSRLVK
jgi:hypothetical protein